MPRFIQTPNAPKPAGHYSQGVVHKDTLYVSGQLAIDPKTGEKILGSIEDQTTQALRNVLAVVEAAGSQPADVVKTTVFVSDISLWGGANQAYAAVFGDHKPARAIVPSRDLHHGFLVEIEAVAAAKE